MKGDVYIGHLTPGEIVIPRALAEDEDLRKFLFTLYKENGIEFQRFVVGSGSNSINPKTGHFQFGWFSDITKSVKKVFSGVTKAVSSIFGGGAEDIELPEVQKVASPAIPEYGEAADYAMSSAKQRSGFSKTILTGALSPLRKKRTLG